MRWLLIITAFWTVPVILGMGRYLVAGSGNALLRTPWAVLLDQAATWYPWALLTPLVWHLARRWGPSRSSWKRWVPAQLVSGLLVCMLYAFLSMPGRSLAEAGTSRFTFLERAAGLFLNGLHVYYLVYWGVLGVGMWWIQREAREPEATREKIVVKTPQGVVLVPLEEIAYVSAADQYVEIQAGERSLLSRESLASMEQRLPREVFYRIHRSTIVNLRHIDRLEPGSHGEFTVRLRGGESLRASRTRSSGLRELLAL